MPNSTPFIVDLPIKMVIFHLYGDPAPNVGIPAPNDFGHRPKKGQGTSQRMGRSCCQVPRRVNPWRNEKVQWWLAGFRKD